MIETSRLTRFFGTRKAIEGVTFSVNRGDTVALLGTNGSGKTTTMRVLCGYLPPTGGAASVAGFDVVSHSLDVRRAVGYLPEDVPLYKDLTITDSLRFFGRLRKMDGTRLDPRIDEVVEQVGMSAYRDVLIGKLSKGYRQRAGLAIAILHDPPVLILIGQLDTEVAWSLEGQMWGDAASDGQDVEFVYPLNADHVLKSTSSDAIETGFSTYNTFGRTLDGEALTALIGWLNGCSSL